MPSVIEAPPKAHPARQKALESFVAKLREWNGTTTAQQHGDRPAKITIGQRIVMLEPWERQQIREWFAASEEAEPRGRYLLAHGAAMMLKTSFDIERVIRGVHNTASTDMYALQAELMLDVAIGMALMKDLQYSVEEEVKAGRFDAAKGLTQFRHRMVRIVNDAKLCIAESEQEQAASLVDSLSDTPSKAPGPAAAVAPPRPHLSPARAWGDSAGTADEVGAPIAVQLPRRRPRKKPAAGRPRPAADAPLPSMTSVLAVLCGIAFAAWLAFTQVPQLLDSESAVMTRAHFEGSLPIRGVESRAPSVFVTIPAKAWGRLDERERLAMIQELGRSAARASFTGLVLRDDAGVPVAHWLSRRGAGLLEASEGNGDMVEPPAAAPPVIFRPVGVGAAAN